MAERKPRPVIIGDYDPQWPVAFAALRQVIGAALGDLAVAIEHVGSTAVPGLAAKPIIDIMAGVRSLKQAAQFDGALAAVGYVYQPDDTIPDRRYYNKGPQHRHRHLHMAELGGEFWQRHLLFRDYLRANPTMADAYATLKRRLAARFGADRIGYTDAKAAFIDAVVRAARQAAGRGVWYDLTKVLAAMGAERQADATAHLAQALWLAVHADGDVDALVVLATQLVNRLGGAHDASPVIAASAVYLNRRRGAGRPLQGALEALALQAFGLCAATRGIFDDELLAWVKRTRLDDPAHVLPALDDALDDLARPAGWLFDRALLMTGSPTPRRTS